MRGRRRLAQNRREAPSPGLLRFACNPTSPRTRGEANHKATKAGSSAYTPHRGRSRGDASSLPSPANAEGERKPFSRRIVCARGLFTTPPQSKSYEALPPAKRGKRSAERRIVQPMSASSAAARCCLGRAPPFGAHACGTRHRLLPRWLSSSTGFPAALTDGGFARFAKLPRLSTLRADRSLCRSTGDPKPPGGHHYCLVRIINAIYQCITDVVRSCPVARKYIGSAPTTLFRKASAFLRI